MFSDNERSSSQDASDARPWTDDEFRKAKPYPLPEAPPPKSSAQDAKSRADAAVAEPGYVPGGPPDAE